MTAERPARQRKLKTYQLVVLTTTETREQIRALAAQHGVSLGWVARALMNAGLQDPGGAIRAELEREMKARVEEMKARLGEAGEAPDAGT